MDTQKTPLETLLLHWNVILGRAHDDLMIAGSPERSLSRTVIEDNRGNLFILEEIAQRNVKRKEEIAGILSMLFRQGLPAIHPPLLSTESYVCRHANRFWTLRPYIEGVPLERPQYVNDGWRGRSAAEFLTALKSKSHPRIVSDTSVAFSITAFIADLLKRMALHDEGLIPRIAPVIDFLDADFFAEHNALPVGFSHGDYHPVNIIWSEDAILSVIDWEFSGYKPEIYDMSLLIGCIGIEDPEALTGPFVQEFLHGLAHTYSSFSLRYIFEFVLAVRFAWLSEWLRNNDREMVELEIDCLDLLMRERRFLKDAWSRCLLA